MEINRKFGLEEIPSEISGVTLTDAVREQLSYGKESPLIEGFLMDDGDIRNAKIRMIRSASGEAEVGFSFQREQLIIPEIIGDYKLSEEDKVRLINREIAGPAKINGAEVFLQVDNELNSVTVKSANDISIKELIVLRHAKNGFDIAGQKLNDNEVRQLIEGKELDTKIYEQDGKLFSARVSLTEDDKGIRFREILTLTSLQAKELQKRLNKRKLLDSNIINAPVEAGINVIAQEQQTNEYKISTERDKLILISKHGFKGIKSYYDWEDLFNKDFMNKYNLTHSFNRAYDEHNVATSAEKDEVRDSSLKLVEKYSDELKEIAANELEKLNLNFGKKSNEISDTINKEVLGIDSYQKENKGKINKDVCPNIKIATAEKEKKPEMDFYKVKSIIQSFGGEC